MYLLAEYLVCLMLLFILSGTLFAAYAAILITRGATRRFTITTRKKEDSDFPILAALLLSRRKIIGLDLLPPPALGGGLGKGKPTPAKEGAASQASPLKSDKIYYVN
jgi:hypothetical protein